MSIATAPAAEPTTGSGHRHLGWALVLISVAQLMVVLDATIANIALPFIKHDLGISQANLSWVVTGYALAFGGLLLLGGRLGDLYGRRRMFMVGVVIFADRLPARRPGHQRGAAARRPGPPGPRRGDRLPRRPGADHHDLPGRPAAQPGVLGLRRDVRRRRRRRPDPRRLADRPRADLLRPRRRRLAADLPDQRADRPARRGRRAPAARGERVAPRRARPARRAVRHPRPGRDRLRPHPGRRPPLRLGRQLDPGRAGRRRPAARRLRGHRADRVAPAAAVPDPRQPQPRHQLRRDDARAGRDVRDVLLPLAVRAERHGLLTAEDRRRVPAVQRRHRGRGHRVVQAGGAGRPALARRHRYGDGRRRAVRVLPAALRRRAGRPVGRRALRVRRPAVHRPDVAGHGHDVRAAHPDRRARCRGA